MTRSDLCTQVVDGAILEKPNSAATAKDMLTRSHSHTHTHTHTLHDAVLFSLSGRGHTVYTGLALVWREGEFVCHEATDVTFATLSAEVIESYVATGEPL